MPQSAQGRFAAFLWEEVQDRLDTDVDALGSELVAELAELPRVDTGFKLGTDLDLVSQSLQADGKNFFSALLGNDNKAVIIANDDVAGVTT